MSYPEKEPQFGSARQESESRTVGKEKGQKIVREIRPEKAEKEESKFEPEDKEFFLEIIEHPLVQKGLARYKIFSEAYFERKGKFSEVSKEEIKQRADKLFENDPIYQDILEKGKPVENEDFLKHFTKELKKKDFQKLREVKGEEFDKTLREIITKREAERQGWETIGKINIEISEDGKICRPHLPRIAEDFKKVSQEIEKSFEELAECLSKDERFKKVERLEGFSWLFGQERIAKIFDEKFGWHTYKKEEIERFLKEKPESYKEAQKTGIRISPRLLKKYLLTGEMPKIDGRWITKEEFIEKMQPEMKATRKELRRVEEEKEKERKKEKKDEEKDKEELKKFRKKLEEKVKNALENLYETLRTVYGKKKKMNIWSKFFFRLRQKKIIKEAIDNNSFLGKLPEGQKLAVYRACKKERASIESDDKESFMATTFKAMRPWIDFEVIKEASNRELQRKFPDQIRVLGERTVLERKKSNEIKEKKEET